MDLRHAVVAIWRWRLLSALLVGVMLLLAGVYSLVATREYRSTATVFFSLTRGSSVSELAQGSTYTQDVVQSYAEVVRLPLVLTPVIQRLGLEETPRELAQRVSVDAKPETVIADITVTGDTAKGAAELANAVASQLGSAVSSLSPSTTSGPSSITVTTISPANPPNGPSSPNVPLALAAGLLAGLMLGVGASIVLELVASPLATPPTVAGIAPVVGSIAYDPKARRRALPVSTHPHLPRAESFRALRTNLRALETGGSLCLVVSSPLQEEGRTSVSVNLAIAVSHSYRSVLLIDADLRKPATARLLRLENRTGLSEVLQGEADLEDVVQEWQTQTWGESKLHVLASGQVPIDPSELLAQPAMEKLLDTVRHRYDVVIIDTPPLLPVTDGALLAAQVDGALLVVNRRSSRERDVQEAVSTLRLAGAQVRGVVFNSTRLPTRKAYGPRRYLFTA